MKSEVSRCQPDSERICAGLRKPPAQEVLGMERLQAIVRARSAESRAAGDLISSLISDVQGYAAGAPQHDDMTVVAVKVL